MNQTTQKRILIIFLISGIVIIILGIIQGILSSDFYSSARGVILFGIFVVSTSGFYYYKQKRDLQFNFNKFFLFVIVTTLIWGVLCTGAGIWDIIWGIEEGFSLLFTGIAQLSFVIYILSLHSKFPSFRHPIPSYMNPNP